MHFQRLQTHLFPHILGTHNKILSRHAQSTQHNTCSVGSQQPLPTCVRTPMRLPLMPRREGDGARSRAHTKWCGVCVRPHIRNDANGSSSRSIRRRGASHSCVGGHALLRSGGRPRLGRHAPPTRQRVNATGTTGKDPDDPGAPPEGTRGARTTTERHHADHTPHARCRLAMFASIDAEKTAMLCGPWICRNTTLLPCT